MLTGECVRLRSTHVAMASTCSFMSRLWAIYLKVFLRPSRQERHALNEDRIDTLQIFLHVLHLLLHFLHASEPLLPVTALQASQDPCRGQAARLQGPCIAHSICHCFHDSAVLHWRAQTHTFAIALVQAFAPAWTHWSVCRNSCML